MQQRRRAGSQRRARPGFTPDSLFTTLVEPEIDLELPVYSSPVNGIVRDLELIFIVVPLCVGAVWLPISLFVKIVQRDAVQDRALETVRGEAV